MTRRGYGFKSLKNFSLRCFLTWHLACYFDKTSSVESIIFETDGKKVTRWRSGKLPEGKFIESCA